MQAALGQALGGLGKVAALDGQLHDLLACWRREYGAFFFCERMLAGARSHEPGGALFGIGCLHAAALLHPVCQGAVVIVAAQRRVATSCQHLEHAFFHAQDGNIKCAAAQVEYGIQPLAGFIQPIGQRSGRGFVDEPQHGQARQLRGVFGGLALRIVEVGRHGNDGAFHLAAQAGIGPLTQGGQQAGADFYRRFVARPRAHAHHALAGAVCGQCIGLPLALYRFDVLQAAPHQALDRNDGIGRVCCLHLQGIVAGADRALLCRIACCVIHGRWQDDAALRIGQALRQAVAHGSHQRVRGTQIDADADAALVRIGAEARFGYL